jgi:ubiquinone/menaquinone biosynthesis C-methylase UbiE
MNTTSWDPTWEQIFLTQGSGKYPSESLIRFVAKNFYKLERKNVRLLDLGCGPGANLWYLCREGFDVFGIDGSDAAIDMAKSRLLSEKLTAHLEVGDVVILPYEDNFFDGVVENECLYCNNVENTSKILAEIKRVLKPNGLLCSRTFSNEMFVGSNPRVVGNAEYQDIQEGHLIGKGFVRLSSKDALIDLYGKHFTIQAIDKDTYTLNNGKVLISEWTVVCKK